MINITVGFKGFINGLSIPKTALSFSQKNMNALGQFAIKTIKARVARGIGSDDSPMPALKHGTGVMFDSRINGRARFKPKMGYAGWKSKNGLQPIRDLTGDGKQGGHMLDNLTVRSVSNTSVKMGFTLLKARQKALSNEKRTPGLSFSDEDERAIVAFAVELFRSNVNVLRRQIFSGGKYIDSPIPTMRLVDGTWTL